MPGIRSLSPGVKSLDMNNESKEARELNSREQMIEDLSEWSGVDQRKQHKNVIRRNDKLVSRTKSPTAGMFLHALFSQSQFRQRSSTDEYYRRTSSVFSNDSEAPPSEMIRYTAARILASCYTTVTLVPSPNSHGGQNLPENQPEIVSCLRKHNRGQHYPAAGHHPRESSVALNRHDSNKQSRNPSTVPRESSSHSDQISQIPWNPVESLQEFLVWSEDHPTTTEALAHPEMNLLRCLTGNTDSSNRAAPRSTKPVENLAPSETEKPKLSRVNTIAAHSSATVSHKVAPDQNSTYPRLLHSLTKLKRSLSRRGSSIGPIFRTGTDPIIRRPFRAFLHHHPGSIIAKKRRNTIPGKSISRPPNSSSSGKARRSLAAFQYDQAHIGRSSTTGFGRYSNGPLRSPHSKSSDKLDMHEYLHETRLEPAFYMNLGARTGHNRKLSVATTNSIWSILTSKSQIDPSMLHNEASTLSRTILPLHTAPLDMFSTPDYASGLASVSVQDYFSCPIHISSSVDNDTAPPTINALAPTNTPWSGTLDTPFDFQDYLLSQGRRPTFPTPQPLLGPAILAPVRPKPTRARSKTLEEGGAQVEKRTEKLMRRNGCADFDVACMLRTGLTVDTARSLEDADQERASEPREQNDEQPESKVHEDDDARSICEALEEGCKRPDAKKRDRQQRRRAMSF